MRRLAIAALVAWLASRSAYRLGKQSEEGTEKSEIANPNMMMFTAKHYAMMRIGGEGERELLPEEPTDEQRLAAYQRFMANAGAYKVDGNMLVTHTKIARSPNAMHDPQPNESMIHMDGDMMHRTWKNAETGNKLVVTYKRAE